MNILIYGNREEMQCLKWSFYFSLQPSKLDLDVLIAIGQTYVDFRKYPCIARWKKLVMSYSEEKQHR